MSAGFWTSKEFTPYQGHNFQVTLDLYAIKEEAYFRGTKGSVDYRPDVSKKIRPKDVQKIQISPHLIKSINLPQKSINSDVEGKGLSTVQTVEAMDPSFENIAITFYAADTEYGNMINLIPRIFDAHYLDWQEDRLNGVASALPFQTTSEQTKTKPNPEFIMTSNIVVQIFRNGKVDDRDLNTNTETVSYGRIQPISYDLGSLSYDTSAPVECTMTFAYNVTNAGTDGGKPRYDGAGDLQNNEKPIKDPNQVRLR